MENNYKIVHKGDIPVLSSRDSTSYLSIEIVSEALIYTHEIFDKFKDFEVDVFGILGMRNLSAFIGEVFAKSLGNDDSL